MKYITEQQGNILGYCSTTIKPVESLKFVDLFCGIGTIRMGFEQAKWECVYSVEWDKHKRRIYGIIFGSEPEGCDITRVQAADIPKSDCWCFGAPCQDFSIAGKREGLEGDRSSLVREVFRLVRETKEEYRPKYLLYENVKGMLSSNKGFDYLEILFEMDSLGYDVEWQLLNSKDFRVPQNRERVFTLGHLRSRGRREVFPIRGNCETSSIKVIGTTVNPEAKGTNFRSWVHDASGIVGALSSTMYKQPTQIMVKENVKQGNIKENNTEGQYALRLTGGGHSGGNHSDMDLIVYDFYNHKQRKDGICGTLTASGNTSSLKCGSFGVMITEATKQGYAVAQEGDSINLAAPGSQTRRGRVEKGVANTLDTSCNQGTLIKNRIRRLTPKECWRLQGIPDYITDKVIAAGISDTQMYRAAGDACTVNVIYEIARRLQHET